MHTPTLVRTALLAVTASVLAACGSAPLSFINYDQVYYHAVINRYPLSVVAVDGSTTPFNPLPISPGMHDITFDAPAVAGFKDPVQKVYPMAIAPCTRYYVAAQRDNRLDQDWSLVVEEVEKVGDCSPATEMKKAMGGNVGSQSTVVSHPAG